MARVEHAVRAERLLERATEFARHAEAAAADGRDGSAEAWLMMHDRLVARAQVRALLAVAERLR